MIYNKRGPLVPYCTIGDDEEVMHSLYVDKNGNSYNHYIEVYIEKPDKIYGFKTVKINLNDMIIMERYGYTDDELSNLIWFVNKNRESMLKYAEKGGIWNA